MRRRRGGFCYELNGLLAALLAELGFSVTLLAARSVNPDDGRLGPEFDHLVLRVDLERPFLVDVGWGETFRTPLALEDGAAQDDYRVHARPDGAWEVTERADGAWRAQYRFDLVPRRLPDFADTCRWQQTDSPFFTGHRVCTLATPDGRVTLMDDRLITTSPTGSSERAVAEDEVPELLERLFGVVL